MPPKAKTFNEPTMGEMLRDLWRARRAVLAGTVTGLIAAAIFMIAAVPQYRASMLIAPAERRAGPDIKALLPDNSSFAVQYLMNSLGSADSGDYMRFEHTLRAPSVAAALLKDEKLMAGIAKARRFRFDGAPKLDTPQKLADYLLDSVAIEPVGTTPLRRVVYKHPDKDFAVYFLAALHEIADGHIRQEIRDRTESRGAYLEQALAATEHPDHRRALTSLLMEQEHVRMILAMDEPFAAIIAEPPSAGVRPQWPKPALVFPVFILCGMMLGYAWARFARGLVA